MTNDAIKVVPTFEEGFLEDEVVDVDPAGEAGVVVGEADIPGLLQREQLLHLGGKNVSNVTKKSTWGKTRPSLGCKWNI